MKNKPNYYDDARKLYFKGKTLKEICDALPVSYSTLKKWKKDGRWEGQKEVLAIPGRRAVDILRERLEKKIEELGSNMTSEDVDEIAKITASIERLDRGPDIMGASIEAMGLYADFLKSRLSAAEMQKQHDLVWAFFEHLEETVY